MRERQIVIDIRNNRSQSGVRKYIQFFHEILTRTLVNSLKEKKHRFFIAELLPVFYITFHSFQIVFQRLIFAPNSFSQFLDK